MKALGKALALLLLGLLLLLVALLFALTHLFDPNDYKDDIQQLARDKAGLELKLNGDIGWSLFPWLGLELTDAQIASAQTPEQTLADVRLLGLSVRVLPLLRREIQMSAVRVDGLNLNLQIDEQGHSNWQEIGKAKRPSPEASNAQGSNQTSTKDAAKPVNARKLQLDIDSLSIKNSRIEYFDARTATRYSIEGLQLSSGEVAEGKDIPISVNAYISSAQPVLQVQAELQGLLRFDLTAQHYQLQDLKLSGQATGEQFAGKPLDFSSAGQLSIDLDKQTAQWSDLKLSANQLKAIGNLNVQKLKKSPTFDGNLSLAAFDLRAFLEGLSINLPAMQDANTLRSFELSSQLAGDSNSLQLTELALKLDDSQLTGQISLADLKNAAARVQLRGDKLDLDRYLPPSGDNSASQARKAEVAKTSAKAGNNGTTELPKKPDLGAWSSSPLLPVASLRKLELSTELQLAQLTLKNMPIDNAQLNAQASAGQISLKQLQGELYGGSFSLTAEFDARTDTPQLRLQPQINNIPVEKLLKAQGEASPVNGELQLSADLQARGNSEKALIDSLSGPATFNLNHGVLVDANLEQQLCQAIATLNRKSLSGAPRSKDTPFNQLGGDLSLRNGIAHSQDLRARIPGLSVKGKGDFDLRVLSLDYHLGITIEGDQRAMPDAACQVNQRYVGLEIPVRCRGPLELGAKACRLDQDGLALVAVKLAGEKLTEKLEEKIEKKLGDKVAPELKDVIKGLFNR